MSVLSVSNSDHESLAKLLARAFSQDPLLRWVIPDQVDYDRFAEGYFRLQLANSSKTGSCFTNSDQTGVALWSGPDEHPTVWSSVFDSIKTIWLLRNNLGRAYRLDELMAGYRPKRHYLHLTHLATSPEAQGNGVAKKLLKPMVEQARELNTPIYLECSNRSNLGFYRQFGFRLVDDIPVTDRGQTGPTIWPMTLEHSN